MADELRRQGVAAVDARKEINAVIDRWVYYAGWSDKYAQVVGSVNPVAGPYYNFTVPEPTGVVGVVAPEEPSLLGFVSRIAPAIVGGNTVVAIPSESRPFAAITLGEVCQTSDVPGGVVNIVSGLKSELVPWLASHMDVNAVDATGVASEALPALQKAAAENVKRIVRFDADAARSVGYGKHVVAIAHRLDDGHREADFRPESGDHQFLTSRLFHRFDDARVFPGVDGRTVNRFLVGKNIL